MGIDPDVVVEPTCGMGAFVLAAARVFSSARAIYGFEINGEYLSVLQEKVRELPKVTLVRADFFTGECLRSVQGLEGKLLVLGNFPWVTNAGQSVIGGSNLPAKSNFQRRDGIAAITGSSNFDISECMLLDVLSWFKERTGAIAMLVKSSVARKVLSEAQRVQLPIADSFVIKIDARKEFGVNVNASLLVIRIAEPSSGCSYDYTVFESIAAAEGSRVGHRRGQTVSDLDAFERCHHLLGASPQKWRSGIKHDAAAVMELVRTEDGLKNGFGDIIDIEQEYLFPLCKGADVGSGRPWRGKYILVPQRYVGEPTEEIERRAPKTWGYLLRHAERLDRRRSAIYKSNPRFAIFGVGEYAFRPWRIAICSLYKHLSFKLIGPIQDRPVMFDDTVYFLSFNARAEAEEILALLRREQAKEFLSSLIFWDDKRPIKTSILNLLDWSKLQE